MTEDGGQKAEDGKRPTDTSLCLLALKFRSQLSVVCQLSSVLSPLFSVLCFYLFFQTARSFDSQPWSII
jgi:hypothetical protein